jgi:hypothetical protein
MFTDAPRVLRIKRCERAPVAATWEVRAAAVECSSDTVSVAPEPLFPARIDQRWLEREVPSLSGEMYGALLERLRAKRWSDTEIRDRVRVLRDDADE